MEELKQHLYLYSNVTTLVDVDKMIENNEGKGRAFKDLHYLKFHLL